MTPQSQSHTQEFCKALAWLPSRWGKLPLAPLIALRYFGYLVLILAVGLALTEGLLRYLSTQRSVVSADWTIENDAINKMNQSKVAGSMSDPIWRSAGILVGPRIPEVRRILVVGDSFVWGDGYLNANDIWWRQLQRELQRRGYFGVEVVAAGISGASTQQELEWLKAPGFLEGVAPDMILLGYVTNDADVFTDDGQPLVRQIGRDVPPPEWAGLALTLGRVAPTLAAQLVPRLTDKWASRVQGAYDYRQWEQKLLEPANLAAYSNIVQALGRFARQSGRPLAVITLPNSPQRDYFEPRYRPVAPLFVAAGLPYFDLLADFIKAYAPDQDHLGESILRWGINPANGHPGTEATRFHARKVADILEQRFPQVLGERAATAPQLDPTINDWMPPVAAVTPVGPSEWRLSYPSHGDRAPRLPVGEPYVMLGFELPVGIRKVRVTGERLQGARLWWTAADPATGVDNGDLLGGDPRHGEALEWVLDGRPGAASVNTLRLAADLKPEKPERLVDLTQDRFSSWGGYAHAALVPELQAEADDDSHAERSPWVILEDGAPLGPAHAMHSDIRSKGHGRWSHWKERVVLSASDSSDPRTNGRRYQLATYRGDGNELRVQIEFNDPAVRP